MAKRKNVKKQKSFSEKVMLVLSILIAISMILGLVVGLGGYGQTTTGAIDSALTVAAMTFGGLL